jgi:hypothetical protein
MAFPDQTILPQINPLQPGAYSAVDSSAFAGTGLPRAPVVAILATGAGGLPLTAMYFRGPGAMRGVLRSGIAYDMGRFAFAGGASRVCVVRVGQSGTIARSTLALAGTSGTGVTLTSLDYGAWTTGINVTVAANNNVTITYVDPFGTTFTENFNVGTGATAVQVATAINGLTTGFAKSNYVSAVAGAGTMPLATAATAPLAGGNDGLAPANSDWTAALTVLETQPVSIVTVGSGSSTIHALALAHANNMSTPTARRERTVVAGGVAGENAATAAARMTGALLDKRFQLISPGMWDFNTSGVLTLYDPFYVSAKVAGMHCSLPDPAFSLAHKRFPAYDIEFRFSTLQGSDVDTLLAASVTPLTPAPGSGVWFADSLSGYRASDAVYADFHKVRSADYVSNFLRTSLEQRFVGAKSLAGSANAIGAWTTQLCTNLVSQQVIRMYQPPVVTPGADTRSYQVSVPVMLVDAIKFIFITVALQPSSTVNTAVGASSATALQ